MADSEKELQKQMLLILLKAAHARYLKERRAVYKHAIVLVDEHGYTIKQIEELLRDQL